MRINCLFVGILGLYAQFAFGQDRALLTKTNVTGFTAPEFARSESCEVFQNKVVISTKFGAFGENSFTNQEVRRINLSPSINKVLESAAAEPLTKSDNYLCDGPSSMVSITVASEKIILFGTGGCGSPRLERQGGTARMLMDLVAVYCPVTHDFGIQRSPNLNN